MCEFVPSELLVPLLSALNSSVATSYFSLISPTLNINAGDIDKFPVLTGNDEYEQLTRDSVLISKFDWDSFETSWDFKRSPML